MPSVGTRGRDSGGGAVCLPSRSRVRWPCLLCRVVVLPRACRIPSRMCACVCGMWVCASSQECGRESGDRLRAVDAGSQHVPTGDCDNRSSRCATQGVVLAEVSPTLRCAAPMTLSRTRGCLEVVACTCNSACTVAVLDGACRFGGADLQCGHPEVASATAPVSHRGSIVHCHLC